MTERGLTAELVGTLDRESVPAASQVLEKYVAEHRPEALVLDLGNLQAVDDDGLRALARWKAAGPHDVRLVNVPAALREQLTAAGL